MVTRRGYLSSTGGFADGFTSGLGLMNQAYTDKRKLDQAEENMQYERERDVARDAESLRRYDASEAAAERRFNAQQESAKSQAELDQQRLTEQTEANKIQAGINTTRAETELLKQQALTAEREAADAEQAQSEYMTRATNAYSRINTMLQAPVGTYSYDQIIAAIDETAGGALDIRTLLGADYQANIAGMTAELRKGLEGGNLDLNNRAILDGLTSLFDNRRGRLIGKTVDETFVNAPDQYKTGDWEVSDRFVTNVKQNADNPSMLSATVAVRVVNKKTGESAYYDAPLTENRGAGAPPAGISIEQALDGIAGTSMLLQEIEKFRPEIERGLIRQKFGDDNLKFENAVDAEVQRSLKRAAEDGEDARSIIPTKTNGSLTIDDHRNLARSKVLGTGRGESLDFRGDRLRVISETKEELAPVLARALQSDADGNVSKLTFTNSEILRMNAIGDKAKIESYVRGLAKNKGGFFQDPKRNPRRGVAARAMEG
jgi:hypothetical protein